MNNQEKCIMNSSNPFTMRNSLFWAISLQPSTGITPTCESQTQIHLKKCMFLVVTLEAILIPGRQYFPLQSCFPAGSPFLFTLTLSRCLKPWLYFPFTMYLVLDFCFQVLRRKLFINAMH